MRLLRHLVLDAAQHQPLVLVVENLHWSDPTSEAWLASLVERLPEAPVLLLGTYRPGYQPPWGAHAAVTQVAVLALHAPESRTIVQAVLGTAALPEARLRVIVAQAGGNPFFLEELAWHAVDTGGGGHPGGGACDGARCRGGAPGPAASRGEATPPDRGGAGYRGAHCPAPAIADVPEADLSGAWPISTRPRSSPRRVSFLRRPIPSSMP